jgi:hypothetical protein
MNLTLSWDLFIIVFFALVVTYSFIIGRKESMKIIVSSYIAIVAVQGIGNFTERILGLSGAQSALGLVGIPIDASIVSIIKLVLFVTVVVFLAVRAGVHVQWGNEGTMVMNIAITALSGFATAGLLLATLLTFISGAPLLDMHVVATPALEKVISQSTLLQLVIQNLDLWFTFPAAVLIAAGFLNNN